MDDEMLIEALCEAHDKEMSRICLGCNPYDDLYETYDEDELLQKYYPEDYMDL